MAFRAIWLIDKSNNCHVIFKKQFANVEKRSRQENGEQYCAIPPNFVQLLVAELTRKQSDGGTGTSCTHQNTPPIYSVQGGKLWPLVVLQRPSFLYCCLVFVSKIPSEASSRAVSLLPGISVGFTLLSNISSFIGDACDELKRKRLRDLISVALPFGVPSHVDLNLVAQMLDTNTAAAPAKYRSPAWRPTGFKGRQSIQFIVREYVRGAQYDRDDATDFCEVYGSVLCKAEVEESPDVCVSLHAPLHSAVLLGMICHPTVQLANDIANDVTVMVKDDKAGSSDGEQYGALKLRFSPPQDQFTLCQYKARSEEMFAPIQGFYQMKGEKSQSEILIQLKLDDNVKNVFESCQVRVPFFNRGPVRSATCVPPSANVLVSPERTELLWNIGTKFPTKTRDLTLQITVEFDESKPTKNSDEFLKGLNSYISLSFKVCEYVFSELSIDTRAIEISPHSRFKSQVAYEFQSVDFKIWNSHGNVLCS